MERKLEGLWVAILVADGFEKRELTDPRKALEDAGAETILISPVKNKVRSWSGNDWSDEFPVDLDLNQADPEEFDALLLPGGVINPDKLRIIPEAIDFIRTFVVDEKPIAAICHGPWTLIDAEGVQGKTMTSWLSLKHDLLNAGANWIDKQVVIDGTLVTSRKPDDIPAFNEAFLNVLAHLRAEKLD